jgi:hypothetical protein
VEVDAGAIQPSIGVLTDVLIEIGAPGDEKPQDEQAPYGKKVLGSNRAAFRF